MNFMMNIAINLYSIIMLLIIFIHSNKHFDRDFLNDIIFRDMMILTGFMLFVDMLSRFDGQAMALYYFINQFGNFAIFLLNPILPCLWLAYVHYQIFEDQERTKKLILPLSIFNILNLILLIGNRFNGWYYYIDSENIYHRGPYYLLSVFFTVLILFISSVLMFLHRDEIKKKRYYSLVFFIFPPVLSMAMQVFFYGTSLILHGIVISMLVLFLNIQNKDLSMDYLTAVNNRKKIDYYLKKKIKESNKGESFSAMILDINNFKQINDCYGHDEGDRALQRVAKLLKEFVGSTGFVGRFGGDEFYIILEKSDHNHLQEMARKIEKGMESYNKTSAESYKLEFSMGYSVYKNDEHSGMENFQKRIDALMYEDKEKWRGKSFVKENILVNAGNSELI